MRKTIKIVELIGQDIRSRQNADFIRNRINECDDFIVLDFKGVSFISRSFADELYTITRENKDRVALKNMFGIVDSMLRVVQQSRIKKRIRKADNADIKEFNDIESLSAFLTTM